jgi:4-hydroxybenzoate polyprenyltransferase
MGTARSSQDLEEGRLEVPADSPRTAYARSRGSAIVGLLHPVPVMMTIVAAIAFAFAAGHGRPQFPLLARVVAIVLFSQVAIAVFNDICDLDSDSISQPRRALPRGVIALGTAYTIVVLCCALTVSIAITLGWWSIVLVTLGTALGLSYSVWFKRSPASWVPLALAFPLLPVWEFGLLHSHVDLLWTIPVVGIPASVAVHLSDALPDREMDYIAGMRGAATYLASAHIRNLCLGLMLTSAVACLALAKLVPLGAGAVVGAAISVGVVLVWRMSDPGRNRYLVPAAAIILGSGWIAALSL